MERTPCDFLNPREHEVGENQPCANDGTVRVQRKGIKRDGQPYAVLNACPRCATVLEDSGRWHIIRA